MTNGWTGSADGTREQRHNYAQPPRRRADVSAIFDNKWGGGAVMEWQKYSAYGVPFLLTPGDHNKDGGISAADQTAFNADYGANNPRADLNKDGVVNSADQTLFNTSYGAAAAGGRWKLSAADVCNRKGYAGYEHEGFGNDLAVPELAHVRHRVLHFGLGRWTRRDPAGYLDGFNMFGYVSGSPAQSTDPNGLSAVPSPPLAALKVVALDLCGGAKCEQKKYTECVRVRNRCVVYIQLHGDCTIDEMLAQAQLDCCRDYTGSNAVHVTHCDSDQPTEHCQCDHGAWRVVAESRRETVGCRKQHKITRVVSGVPVTRCQFSSNCNIQVQYKHEEAPCIWVN